ncbi:hypothetical protein SAMN04487965_0080 [Microbulbifer donghaiensis]|uniref:Uncharacterized protein n=1 Tax=Microbulbifer donghaiensis TaxID=494016 RepID=A0A1M4U775_9GAMM|nr:hypothetical protein [Microbulbifer donghaiensis]SHE52619.1 hypothetical protein SAMN04487965_0080 [Microbulbifer donghaiensis]
MAEIDELLATLREVAENARRLSMELCDFISAESLSIADVTADWFDLCPSNDRPISEQVIARIVEHRQTATRIKASRLFSEIELAILDDWQALEVKALTFSLNALLKAPCAFLRT